MHQTKPYIKAIGENMDWYQIEHNWTHAKIHIKQQWDKLTDSQLDFSPENREQLVKEIYRTYKISLYEAEQQLSEWQDSLINIDGHFYQLKP
jgi:hypothetical protein